MRILFTPPPNVGMAFTLVPLAQAATAAGHEVIFATASATVQLVANAGLHAVDVAPGADFDAITPDAAMAFLSNRPDAASTPVPGPHFFQQYADIMADGILRLAAAWPADVVVHPPEGVAARTVFDKLGVPTVFHGTGFAHRPNAVEPWKRGNSALVPDPAQWGITAAIDVSPPSMSLVEDYGWRMRYIPFNGGGTLPGWLFEEIQRPRIAVTLGTVAPGIVGVDPLRWLLDVAAKVDAEFVFALGGTDPASLGDRPDNVRAVRWVPLNALLQSCAAVVHHGGSGSTMAALNAGLPQVVLPQGADQFDNAEAISKRGVGFVASEVDSSTDAVHRVLSDSALRSAARAVRAELCTLPSPVDIVHRLVEHLAVR